MAKIIAVALLVVGALLSLQASWLPAKAWLSQQLIQASWQQAMVIQQQNLSQNRLSSPIAIKPWPWADTFPTAELTFPRLEKNIVVLNGGDPTTLAFSAGAIAPFNQTNTANPFVVAGHRDSHFAFLQDIMMKDVIALTDAQGRTQLYQVETIEIIDASTGQLALPAHEANLVLITCYPFTGLGNNTDQRYIITAKAV